jgi:hypothetical protein
MTKVRHKRVPNRLRERDCEGEPFDGTIADIRRLIRSWVRADMLKPDAPVWLYDCTDRCPEVTATRYAGGNVRQIYRDLVRLIKEGAGEDRWRFNWDDGWYGVVLALGVHGGALYCGCEDFPPENEEE